MTAPTITRKQAWCMLAVLIADGLPTPEAIDFNVPSGNTIFGMSFDTVEDMHAWAKALDCAIDAPIHHPGSEKVQHHASAHRSWNGLSVSLWAYAAASDEAPVVKAPDVDGMDAVRAIAAGVSA